LFTDNTFLLRSCFYISPALIKLLSTGKYRKIQLSGIVFDSAPTSYSHKSGVAAAKLIKQHSHLAYYTCTAMNVGANALTGWKRHRKMRATLDHLIVKIPQLIDIRGTYRASNIYAQVYLYSNTNTVTLKEEVEEEMDRQASRGVDINSH